MAGAAAGSAAAAAAVVSLSLAASRAVPRAAAAASSSSSGGRRRTVQSTQTLRRSASDLPSLPPLFLCPALSAPAPSLRKPSGARRRFLSSLVPSQAVASSSSPRTSDNELDTFERSLQAQRNTLRPDAPSFNALSPASPQLQAARSRRLARPAPPLDLQGSPWLDARLWLLLSEGGPPRDAELSKRWDAEDAESLANSRAGAELQAIFEAAQSVEKRLDEAQARAPQSPLSPAQKAQVLDAAHAELAACWWELGRLLRGEASWDTAESPPPLPLDDHRAASRCLGAILRAGYVLGPSSSADGAPGTVAATLERLEKFAARPGFAPAARHVHSLVSRAASVGDMKAVLSTVNAIGSLHKGRLDDWLLLWKTRAQSALGTEGRRHLKSYWLQRVTRQRRTVDEALVPTSRLCGWLLHLCAASEDLRGALKAAAVLHAKGHAISSREWLLLAGTQPRLRAALAAMARTAPPGQAHAASDLANLSSRQLLDGLVRQLASEADVRGILRALRLFGAPTGGMRPAARPNAPSPTAETYAPLAIYFSSLAMPSHAVRFARLALQHYTEPVEPRSPATLAVRMAVQRAAHSLIAAGQPQDALAFALATLRFSPSAKAELRPFASSKSQAGGVPAAALDATIEMYPVLLRAAAALPLESRVYAARALLKELFRAGHRPDYRIRRAIGYLLVSTIDKNGRLLRRFFAPVEPSELLIRVDELSQAAAKATTPDRRHAIKARARELERFGALLTELDHIGFQDRLRIAGDRSHRARMRSRAAARESAPLPESFDVDEDLDDGLPELPEAPRAVEAPAFPSAPVPRPHKPVAVPIGVPAGPSPSTSRPQSSPVAVAPSAAPQQRSAPVAVPLSTGALFADHAQVTHEQESRVQEAEFARMLVEQEAPLPREPVAHLHQDETRPRVTALLNTPVLSSLREQTPPDTATHVERETDFSHALSPSAYAMRMRVYAVLWQDLDSAVRLFRSMLEHKVRPTMLHIAPLVEGFVQQGRLREAQLVLDEAVAKLGLAPTLRLHSAMIRGYARLGQWDAVQRQLRSVRSAGLEVDVGLQAMLAHARSADPERRLDAAEAAEQDASIEQLLAAPTPPATQAVSLHFEALIKTWRFLSAHTLVRRALDAGMHRDALLRRQVHRSGSLIAGYRRGQLRGPPAWARGEDGAELAPRELSAQELDEAAMLQRQNRKRLHEHAAAERYELRRMRRVRCDAVRLAFDALVTYKLRDEVQAGIGSEVTARVAGRTKKAGRTAKHEQAKRKHKRRTGALPLHEQST